GAARARARAGGGARARSADHAADGGGRERGGAARSQPGLAGRLARRGSRLALTGGGVVARRAVARAQPAFATGLQLVRRQRRRSRRSQLGDRLGSARVLLRAA